MYLTRQSTDKQKHTYIYTCPTSPNTVANAMRATSYSRAYSSTPEKASTSRLLSLVTARFGGEF